MLTLRGVAVGAGMYVALAVIYVIVDTKAAHLGPGQQIGWDVRSMAGPMFRSPMFWITFIVLAAIGSMLVNIWRSH